MLWEIEKQWINRLNAGVQPTVLLMPIEICFQWMLNKDRLMRQALQNTRGVVAGFKDKEFDYNQAQPYDQTMAAAEGYDRLWVSKYFWWYPGRFSNGVRRCYV